MAKELTPEIEPTKIESPVDVALDEWCEGRSRELGRRVEALTAFYKRCLKLGVGRATPEKFEADFQAFLKSPV